MTVRKIHSCMHVAITQKASGICSCRDTSYQTLDADNQFKFQGENPNITHHLCVCVFEVATVIVCDC